MKLKIVLFCFTLFFFIFPQKVFAQSCAQNAVCCRASATNTPTCIGGGSCPNGNIDCCPNSGDNGSGYNYVCKNDNTPNQADQCSRDCGVGQHCELTIACPGACETSATQCNDIVAGSCVPISGGQCGTNCPIGYSILSPCGAASAPTPTPQPGTTPPPGGVSGCGGPCTTVANCSIAGAINPACSGGICWDGAVCGGGGGCGGGCGSCSGCNGPDSECREQLDCTCKRDFAKCCDADWTDCQLGADGIAIQKDLNNCKPDRACEAQVYARGWIVPPGASCSTMDQIAAKYPANDDLRSATEAASGTRFQFTADSAANPVKGTQNDGRYVRMNIRGGTSVLDPRPASNSVSVAACWKKKNASGNAVTSSGQGLGFTVSVPDPGERIYYDIGYLAGVAWSQVGNGGDVYVATTLRQFLSSAVDGPRSFMLDGIIGKPGVLTVGGAYDLDPMESTLGENYISSEDWIVADTVPPVDYFQKFYQKFGAPTTESALNKVSLTKPASGTYYLRGPVATSTTTSWAVAAGEKIIIFVDNSAGATDASFTVNQPITVATGGFLAVVVNGDIIVSTNVGVAQNSIVPVLHGVYITSLDGSFISGPSTVGIPRFVARGTFVAGDFILQRDLGDSTTNARRAAELFYYNPDTFIYAPEEFKDVSVSWEEIAP